MSDGNLSEVVKNFFADLTKNPIEERVVQYVIKEVHHGRHLSEVLDDPYVKNRLSEEKIQHMLTHNKELIEAVQKELEAAFEKKEFNFWE